jgi:Ca2+-binding RTX toxin-like protein
MGGFGNDTYRYASGDGNDVIRELNSGFIDSDTLRFTNLNASDLTFGRSIVDTNDLLINITATGEVITVDDHFVSTTKGIEQIQFADSSAWDRGQIASAAWLQGTAGADTINGTIGNDTLVGLGGADILLGDFGNDTYRYASGDGNDIIRELNSGFIDSDTLRFTNLNASDVTFGRSITDTNDLLINIIGTGELITVDDHFVSTTKGIEQIVFANSSTMDRAQIASSAWLQGTAGADTINGTIGNDTIVGMGGADILLGDFGNDVYRYAAGDGNDIICELNSGFTDSDTLRFTNLNVVDLTFARSVTDTNDL